eukprot:CAMPEP_0170370428 /NCGR_PEP_ID=MMETSP0117_2-20130122/8506_1 /TAXON_ID=400756 /ORGANISM="Durinskia baltica, Strain CSIRO CS-38" /LENGTH=282 /DNA_ID=CAMNT_0010625203 /DNA_START=133 /DNA_END=981 /DNA_ORIENTATION=+
MIDEDTPRSARSVGYGSPRDDRFYTPRTVARSNSNSNSEEWTTPRFETPRYETPRYGTQGYNSQSDGEFQTPRAFDTERKMDRKEIYPTLMRRGSIGDSPRIYDNPYAAAPKSTYQREISSKESGYYKEHPSQTPDQYTQSPARAKAQHKYIDDIDEESEYVALDLAAAGLSEKDVEDVFSYARHGRCEEIERLFSKGLPVDVRDSFGNTVLIIACQNGNKRVAKAVLRRGANINSRNHKGNTPLHYCYHYGYGDSLGQYLISKGADADARNNAGKTIEQGI